MRVIVVGEGPRDKMLNSPVEWVLLDMGVQFESIEADYTLVKQNGGSVSSRLDAAVRLYNPDLVILHRDSDSQDPAPRVEECERAAAQLSIVYSVPCVPVRMCEAWFLFDERALRMAAGNPSGRIALELPTVSEAERMANPKRVIEDSLLRASGCTGRRLTKFQKRLGQSMHRLADLIDDYAPLRVSRSFSDFEQRLRESVQRVSS